MKHEDQALLNIGSELKKQSYNFKSITPESHRRVLERNINAKNLRDIFGWNRPFTADSLDSNILELLTQAQALKTTDDVLTSQIRFASLYDNLYLHSGFPTIDQNAVFFGPDTYRYARLLRQHVDGAERVVDIGCGSGAGGLCLHDRVKHITLADINPQALNYAGINASLAGISDRVETIYSDVLASVENEFDLVVSNPPYLVDDTERAYRHGGDLLGAELSVRIARESLQRLAPGGKLVLYTATAIVDGIDTFWQAVEPLINEKEHKVFYEEIDPDVFGEELDRNVYSQTDRLAVIGLVVQRR